MLGDVSGRVGKPGYGPGWGRMAIARLPTSKIAVLALRSAIVMAGCLIWAVRNGKRDAGLHQKFGMGSIELVDADKLEIAFDKAGLKGCGQFCQACQMEPINKAGMR